MPSASSYTARLGTFLKAPKYKLYCSYALSTWSDRLWQFALTLVLVEIGGDLRLVALNGLVDCLVVLLFASSIGRWIDVNKRLFAARTMLTITNVTVAMSAGVLMVVIYWEQEIYALWDGAVRILLIVLAIMLCAISILTGIGTKIVLTKDWVVVTCNNEKDELAEVNAMMLRIDLTTMILSPLIAGQLMTSISVVAGCLFITAWNTCSWGIEFWLLNIVYAAVPALAVKHSIKNGALENPGPTSLELVENAAPRSDAELQAAQAIPPNSQSYSRSGCCAKMLQSLESALNGWRIYYRHSVFPAGLSLALLYSTVLGFDGITTGYAYSQGLKENILALARGVGALVGISGTILFPWMQSKVGLIRTGLFSFAMELSCLLLSVGSIWLPGSPFEPLGHFWGDAIQHQSEATNVMPSFATTMSGMNFTQTTISDSTEANGSKSQWSIWIFLVGIVLARCGLWMADLTVSQIMQESIAEQERGVINGVQSSVNQLMSMIKDLLVIALPDPPTFGLLVIASWISVFFGYISYMVYARRIRGHILPFHKKIASFQNDILRNDVVSARANIVT